MASESEVESEELGLGLDLEWDLEKLVDLEG